MNYFWKNDLVELKILDYDMEAYLEKSLYDDKTRKQLEKGIAFPVTKDTAVKMIEQSKTAFQEGEELWFSILNLRNEMVYDTDACVLFDCDVKLPYVEKELSDSEKSHLQFGGSSDRIEFAITDKEGNFVGNINLCGIDNKNGKFSYSVYVLREQRGKRYAQKALHLLLYYAFEELRMHKLITCVNMGNGPSAGMMRNEGCVVEGVLRDNMFYHGKYIDTVVMGLTEEEFRKSGKTDIYGMKDFERLF